MAAKGGGDKILGRLRLETSQLEQDIQKINNLLGTIGIGKSIDVSKAVTTQIRKELDALIAKAEETGKKIGSMSRCVATKEQTQDLRELCNAIKLAAEYTVKYNNAKESDKNAAARYKEQALEFKKLAEDIKAAHPELINLRRYTEASEAAIRKLKDAMAMKADAA